MKSLRFCLLIPVLAALCVMPNLPASAQENNAPSDEMVANLAAGRVVVAVVKNAILVATVENPIEADTRPPTPVFLASGRLGILLGPVQWWSPDSKVQIASLDQELPQLRSHLIAANPHLQAPQGGDEATDMESIGQGLLERLSAVAQSLHTNVDLPANEPLLQLVVVDYAPGYGPEVWQLAYKMKQQQEQSGFWTTHVLRPAYLQFWPPEKGQPRTLVDFTYPPENPAPTILDLLREKDPRVEKIIASDPRMAAVADHFLAGDSGKIPAADATQFLRATLEATAPPNSRETMAMITEQTGCEWILAPPPEPKFKIIPGADRPADAPTLRQLPQY